MGRFLAFDNFYCPGHLGFAELWEKFTEEWPCSHRSCGFSDGEKRGANAHGVGDGDMGHIGWEHGIFEEKGA